jgi:phosphatidate cytidylyltransferase
MTSPPLVKPPRMNDLAVRALSALVLIPTTVAAVVFAPPASVGHGGWFFLLLVVVGAAVLCLEWGKMSAPATPIRIGVGVMMGVVAAVIAAWLDHAPLGLLLLVFGAGLAAVYARVLKGSALDAAYGVLYIGWPCVVLVWLRMRPDDGLGWTIMLFAVAWSADICAYLLGSMLKGPKLWPRFSPNKTWSGFIGGLAAGSAAAVIIALYAPTVGGWLGLGADMDVRLPAWVALAVGLFGALATMGGDLWESALKRRYGVKDAGDLIPGHGGLLDRVDGMMFAVVALAACRLIARAWGQA